MFGLSFNELMVCLAVGIVLIPSEKWPIIIRKIGQFMGQIQRIYVTITDELTVLAEAQEKKEK